MGQNQKGTSRSWKAARVSRGHCTGPLAVPIGKLNAATKAILPAPLFYRELQECLEKTLTHSAQSYMGIATLSQGTREELQRWVELSMQLPWYFSWRPDPEALATDAFTQDWSSLKGYANPPWNLLNRVLAQTQSQGADLILVVPVWKTQTWYPALLGMLTDYPALIPPQKDLMLVTSRVSQPATQPQLAVWHTNTTTFRRKLQSSSLRHGGRSPLSHTTHSFGSGLAGAINRMPIPFQGL